MRVLVEHEGPLTTVTLNRPDKLNGLDLALFQALDEAGASLKGRRETRVVLLRGAGPAFCAGLDFPSFMAGGPEARDALINERRGPGNLVQRVCWVWRELEVPVIAAVHGHCYGGGLQIAMGADLRVGHPDTRMSVMEIKWGIIPDMGFTRTLMGTVRSDVLAELTWTGRVVSGTEAQALGLLTYVDPDPLAKARSIAEAIAGRSPDAVRAAKAMMRQAPDLSTAEAFALETELQVPLLGSPNQMEAVMANLQKRPPRFQD